MKASVRAHLEAKNALTPTAKAQKAAEIRWERYDQLKERLEFDWDNMPLAEALKTLEAMLTAHHKGARIYERRLGEKQAEKVFCEFCGKERQPNDKWAVAPIAVKLKESETYRNAHLCSAGCKLSWDKAGRPLDANQGVSPARH